MTPNTIIIGGGVAGASVAYHLAERGMSDVIILDRFPMMGAGSTGKATGGVRAQFETDVNIRQSLYSLDFFREWEHDAEYDPKGYIFLASNDRHLEYLARTALRQRELGYREVRLVTPDEIAKMVPGLNVADILGGSFGPRDGFINPLAVLRGFMDGAVRRGVRLSQGVEVTRLIVEKDRIAAVQTAEGMIKCGNVVLAAGAWAAELAAAAGIDLPVRPQRRQIVWARTLGALPPGLPMVIDLKDGFHFRPAKDFSSPPCLGGVAAATPLLPEEGWHRFGDGVVGADGVVVQKNFLHPQIAPRLPDGVAGGEVLFAWPDPDEPSSLSTEFDPSFLEKVVPRAAHRAPFLADAHVVHEKCRAGLYENTPDHHAILGPSPVRGLYLAAGFSGHGVMHSPATGRALAEYILDGKVSFMDVSQLSFDRFEKGELLHETSFI